MKHDKQLLFSGDRFVSPGAFKTPEEGRGVSESRKHLQNLSLSSPLVSDILVPLGCVLLLRPFELSFNSFL
jgi:hypothetical protein